MALAACGAGAGEDGYVAVQRPPSGGAVAPTGDVELVPLEGLAAPEGPGESRSPGPTDAPASGSGAPVPGAAAAPGAPGGGRTTSPGEGDSGRTSGSSGPGAATGSPARPAEPEPAALSVGDPEREPTDKRWCEKVTVGFRNTGGTAVRSGTVTFGTHIIGALGIDWATVESSEKVPAPIAPGTRREKTWTVCVDAWRVPLGMRIETRDVSVRWE
ncbi:hypothetical protein [Streptomyces sp. 2A115]|uniref:hypothetical protein n=1 Tax=Streptomyces sp. 2A115 TaxID=3457439 RepID=UPI003FD1AC89